MVFKTPGNGRGDKPGRSSNRANKPDDRPKRPSSRGRSTDQSDWNKPAPNKSTERSDDRRSSSSAERKPYAGKIDSDNKSSFSGGEKRSYSPRKPYSGRSSDGDSGRSAGRSKPYSGRVSGGDSDRQKRGFSKDPDEKKTFASHSKSYSDRPAGNEGRPKRSPDSYRGHSNEGGERKFSKPSAGGFKKGGSEPFRKSPNSSYNKTRPERETPVKTLRGRKEKESKDSGLIRLNRYIANAGICSRRKADELIEAGVVSVNGEVISELGHKVDPLKDEIRYNGELLKREKMVYVLLNKPKDYITTTDDPQERRTVMHLVEKASRERIYPIGRLDRNTTGLLLMTNDGELADKLSHPRSNITKLYQVELSKSLTQGDLNKIQFGLELEDGLIKPDSVSYVQGGSKREVGIQIHSGKNRIVRRIFEHLGYEVVKLDRVVYANLTKKDLPRGRWRYLDEKEIIQLKHLV